MNEKSRELEKKRKHVLEIIKEMQEAPLDAVKPQEWTKELALDEFRREFDIIYRILHKMDIDIEYVNETMIEGLERRNLAKKPNYEEHGYFSFCKNGIEEYEKNSLLRENESISYDKQDIEGVNGRLGELKKELDAVINHLNYMREIHDNELATISDSTEKRDNS